jgi:predicted ATPase/class 3 adenylate cyclase
VFLFTDLESSTRLWEHHPEPMRVALARHDSILREAIAAAGGVLVKSTGDGLLAAFDSVAGAVGTALVAQRGLATERWTTPEPLRVRMGIHVGDGELRDGDYYGPAVNRAARIMAAAHGGQTLVSGATAAAASATLPDGATLTDLGTHRLKDLILPEHLFQLSHRDLRSDFPPPATLEGRPTNLPTQVSEFFGRESEIESVQAMLDAPTTRILTLAGPGGAGKTRLALQVAADRLDSFPDGVFFVDLAAETSPDAAYESILRALDIPPGSGGNALDVLAVRLRNSHMLLVLDNFEQVTDAAAGVVDLVQRAPGLTVLITSREALRVRGERIFPVPPLGLPDPRAGVDVIAASEAVRLFVERAQSVRRDFSIDDTNASTVAEICLRLDGLPLAVELAAARLNVFTPGDLLDRLRTRLDVLGAGGRDLPARQRTLWGAIGWSYELLDPDERAVFEMMSVFSPTDMRALEAVAADALDGAFIIDALSSLVDKSLIRATVDGGMQRFSMLHTIREFAAERLAATPQNDSAVRAAHARYFSELIERLGRDLRSERRDEALEILATTIGNLRTAWRHWVEEGDLERIFSLIDSLWALHDAKGWYHAAIQLARDALGVIVSSDDSTDRAADELTLRTSLARALMAVQGYTVEVEQAFADVLELAEEAGGTAQRFPVLRALGSYRMNIADFAGAAELGRTLLDMAEDEDDDAIRIDGHYLFGVGTAFGGGFDEGLVHLERALGLFDPVRHGSGRFRLGVNVGVAAFTAQGMLLWMTGSLDRGVASMARALDVARRLGHPYSLSYALFHNGLLGVFRMRFDDVAGHARELATVAGEHEYLVWSTLAKVLEGVSLTASGHVEEGFALTEAGIDLYQGLTTPPVFWPSILALRATVHAFAGRAARGLELIDEALGIVGYGDPTAADFQITRGDILQMIPAADVGEAEAAYAGAMSAAGAGLLARLRASTRLVMLRRAANAADDGTSALADLYGRLTEGFEETDVAAAAAVLAGEGAGP